MRLENLAGMGIPASIGFPEDYPVARVMVGQQEVILRPLKNPLYDTELIAAAATANQVQLFQRQLGQTTAVGALVKTLAETNMRQSGSLPSPQHYQIFGFIFQVQKNCSIANHNALYDTCVYTFAFGGNRVYLEIQLTRMPPGTASTGFASTTVGATSLGAITNGVGHVSNIYNFTLGKKALQIRPVEAFNITLQWPTAAPVLVATDFAGAVIVNIRLTAYIVGILYQQL